MMTTRSNKYFFGRLIWLFSLMVTGAGFAGTTAESKADPQQQSLLIDILTKETVADEFIDHATRTRLIQKCLARGANLDEALWQAAYDDNANVVQAALNAGATPILIDALIKDKPDGEHIKPEIRTMLIQKSLQGDGAKHLQEVFWQGAKDGNRKLVEAALHAGAELNYQHDGNGSTAIYEAVAGGHKDVAKLLRRLNADESWRPAVKARQQALVKKRKGVTDSEDFIWYRPAGAHADISIPVASIDMELFGAALNGNLELVRFLVAHGANVNYQGQLTERLTPLFIAGIHGHAEVVRYLLTHGADLSYLSPDRLDLPVWLERMEDSPQRNAVMRVVSAAKSPRADQAVRANRDITADQVNWINPLSVADVDRKLKTGEGGVTKKRKEYILNNELVTEWYSAYHRVSVAYRDWSAKQSALMAAQQTFAASQANRDRKQAVWQSVASKAEVGDLAVSARELALAEKVYQRREQALKLAEKAIVDQQQEIAAAHKATAVIEQRLSWVLAGRERTAVIRAEKEV